MRLSRFFLPILKETPKEAEIVSHRYMLRAGMVRQQSAGIYSWLPLGQRVLRKVERIVEEEEARIVAALCGLGAEATAGGIHRERALEGSQEAREGERPGHGVDELDGLGNGLRARGGSLTGHTGSGIEDGQGLGLLPLGTGDGAEQCNQPEARAPPILQTRHRSMHSTRRWRRCPRFGQRTTDPAA